MRFHLIMGLFESLIDALTCRLEAMQDAAKPATSSDLTSLIQEMEARHKQDISKLMDVQTKDHISRVLDTYQSVDGIVELYDLDVSGFPMRICSYYDLAPCLAEVYRTTDPVGRVCIQ